MSEQRGDQIHIETVEASAGTKNNVVRYVLGFSMLAAILLLSTIWILGATNSDEPEPTLVTTTDAMPQGGQ